ncbi:MAG: redoxin domain-containing protein, partial [Planctomycetota bacterium]
MKRALVRLMGLLIAFTLALIAQPQTNAQQLRFQLPDSKGQTVAIEAGDAIATAVCFLGTQCPMAKAYASILSKMQNEFEDRGVRIVGVMSNSQDSLRDIQEYTDSLKVSFPILFDKGHLVADQFGARRTPEVFLLDRELKTRYHGRIDDQFAPSVARASATREDLRIAIEELLAGKSVSVKETSALGCVIGRTRKSSPSSDASITYYRDVLPVLQSHCIECHRDGEIGPFQMSDYAEVVGWAETMLETMEDGRMPPWHADPSVGDFSNARHLPAESKELFKAWIEEGCPE